MKRVFVLVSILATLGVLAADVAVTGVSGKQRWPWNNLVDVDFTVTGVAGEKYVVAIDAQCAGGAKKFSASTLLTEPLVTPGTHRITWDFGKDYPGVRAEDMSFAVSVTPQSGSTQWPYVCVDLSGGPDAASYPVRYSLTGPNHVQGATGEPCQTTELWLRRVPAPTQVRNYGWYNTSSARSYYARQTKDYYVGVFEVTQKQYALVTGEWPSFFANETCRDSRPVEQVSPHAITKVNYNVQAHPETIDAGSFLGKIRAKTGLALTLPTLAQWEWACLGGKEGTGGFRWYLLADGTTPPETDIMRIPANANVSAATADSDLSAGTAAVGTYKPNAFGLYDMLGNVTEFTCEKALTYDIEDFISVYRQSDATLGTPENPLVDPIGAYPDADAVFPVFNQVSWNNYVYNYIWVTKSKTVYGSTQNSQYGFRLAITVE